MVDPRWGASKYSRSVLTAMLQNKQAIIQSWGDGRLGHPDDSQYAAHGEHAALVTSELRHSPRRRVSQSCADSSWPICSRASLLSSRTHRKRRRLWTCDRSACHSACNGCAFASASFPCWVFPLTCQALLDVRATYLDVMRVITGLNVESR